MKEYANPNLARSRSCAGAVDHVCQPSGFVPGAPGEAMYGPILRTCTAMPAAAACSAWSPRVVRPLPCRRAPRATRAISSIMMMLT